ncbi:hypothetical protein KsCSTR_40670 [Candidatus Kuenenia stuttgartiensis]|uniref:Uncharacterized protein n=1 Tax=Kuenenia stuttgartiensis TaxID=174633 RepID=Q1Q7L4_KUEST|nr:hypothetical protein KsCSTR_40670 [Candidatus Kuenenia stuttgartiensis]CAJ70804.1 unknown protein [Candidatus Kuenenia stuttgartiensis]
MHVSDACYTVRSHKYGFLKLDLTFVNINSYSISEITFCELLEFSSFKNSNSR